MSKELQEEVLFPSCDLHFAAHRAIIGMCPQDVERDAAHNGKILRPIVLACSCVVLVEDDVELPMQLIFYAPVGARDLEHAAGRKPSGQHDVMDSLGRHAIGLAL